MHGSTVALVSLAVVIALLLALVAARRRPQSIPGLYGGGTPVGPGLHLDGSSPAGPGLHLAGGSRPGPVLGLPGGWIAAGRARVLQRGRGPCAPLPCAEAAGDACSASGCCTDGRKCVGGVCVASNKCGWRPGDDCSASNCCTPGLRCRAGVCQPCGDGPGADCAASGCCTREGDCVDGKCDYSACGQRSCRYRDEPGRTEPACCSPFEECGETGVCRLRPCGKAEGDACPGGCCEPPADCPVGVGDCERLQCQAGQCRFPCGGPMEKCGLSGCCRDGYECRDGPDGLGTRCRPACASEIGAACNLAGNGCCPGSGLRCGDEHTCVCAAQRGDPCGPGGCCYGQSVCGADGVCRARAEGEECSGMTACAAGLSCASGRCARCIDDYTSECSASDQCCGQLICGEPNVFTPGITHPICRPRRGGELSVDEARAADCTAGRRVLPFGKFCGDALPGGFQDSVNRYGPAERASLTEACDSALFWERAGDGTRSDRLQGCGVNAGGQCRSAGPVVECPAA